MRLAGPQDHNDGVAKVKLLEWAIGKAFDTRAPEGDNLSIAKTRYLRVSVVFQELFD